MIRQRHWESASPSDIRSLDGELWAVVEQAPLYWVSNYGRILGPKGIRKLALSPYGYPYFTTLIGDKICALQVHRLVAKAFIPNPENKPEVNHKNGVKNEGDTENLEWVTRSENLIHRYRILELPAARGEKHVRHKVTSGQVSEIRRLREETDLSLREIGELFGVHGATVSGIVQRTRWKHIA